MKLSDSISTIKGIGPKKQQIFAANGIETIEDFLYFFPRAYEDRRKVTPISELREGTSALIKGRIVSKRYGGRSYYRKNMPLSLTVSDGSASIEIVFFNAKYLVGNFNVDDTFMFYGKVSSFMGNLRMSYPQYFKEGSSEDIRDVVPVYPLMQGISQKEMRKIQLAVTALADDVEEWLDEEIVRKNRLCSPAYAIKNIHFPKEGRKVLEGKYRLIFEEFLTLETGLMYIRKDNDAKTGISIDCKAADDFLKTLSFELTDDQWKVWEKIRRDMESRKSMNRLLQGDVGSGKTVIAQLAMYSAAKAGYQSVIMAPTELLTRQHFATFLKDFEGLDINVGLLCSSMKAADKKITINKLKNGEIDILAATHAVLQDNVEFKNLGLAVTDEQHRFGVGQRKLLSSKEEQVNVLVMTATPIPRTLAVVLYGDLDISQIKTMPKGRKPVTTIKGAAFDRRRIYNFLETEIKKGRQAYVVAPLIEDSDKLDVVSADGLFAELKDRFKNYSVGMVHGRMKQDEKEVVMKEFVTGKTDILVSTVVIEVGINVPNASVMVVENAERFGLAQLHQLRGRVGRGSEKSFCILMCDSDSDTANKRIDIMCRTSDGFLIAEEDLRLRGPGEIFGTRQHGIPELHISDLVKHAEVLEAARDAAKEIIEKDPCLAGKENEILKRKVRRLFGDDIKLDL